jgi:hypothetical protein
MMKKILFFFLLPAVAFIAPEKLVVINGSINTPDPVRMIYVAYRNGDISVNDSTVITNGEFTFKENVEEPTMAVLTVKFEKQDGKTNTRVERKLLFLEPGNITITIKDSLKFATVSGSKAHTDYETFTQLQKPYNDAMQVLSSKYMAFSKEKNEAGMKQLEGQADSLNKKKNEDVVKTFPA